MGITEVEQFFPETPAAGAGLRITRRSGQWLFFGLPNGEVIKCYVLGVNGSKEEIRLLIEAPQDVALVRGEVLRKEGPGCLAKGRLTGKSSKKSAALTLLAVPEDAPAANRHGDVKVEPPGQPGQSVAAA